MILYIYNIFYSKLILYTTTCRCRRV